MPVCGDKLSHLFATAACYASGLGYGMCLGSFGAAIPELSKALNISEGRFGELLLLRGIGYLIGTIFVSLVVKRATCFSKHSQTAITIALSAMATFLFQVTRDFTVYRVLSLMQGVGFGSSDTLVVLAISDLWGNRAQVCICCMGLHVYKCKYVYQWTCDFDCYFVDCCE